MAAFKKIKKNKKDQASIWHSKLYNFYLKKEKKRNNNKKTTPGCLNMIILQGWINEHFRWLLTGMAPKNITKVYETIYAKSPKQFILNVSCIGTLNHSLHFDIDILNMRAITSKFELRLCVCGYTHVRVAPKAMLPNLLYWQYSR